MRKLATLSLLSVLLLILLAGCGQSTDKQLEGAWKIVDEQDGTRFLEFSEDRMVVRNGVDSQPETADYRLTDLKKGKFIIEIAEPGTQTYQFFLEGKLEKKDKIEVARVMDSNETNPDIQLVKVKDMDKEMAKARKEQEKAEAAQEKKRKKEEKEAAAKEAERLKAQEEQAAAEEQKRQEAAAASANKQPAKQPASAPSSSDTNNGSVQSRYSQKADQLEAMIISEARAADPNAQDIWDGFYGQYYEQWDDLLNEIWGVLKQNMSADDFNKLKVEQRAWLEQKEKEFSQRPDDTAASRANGMDFLAFRTEERVRYLIENYMY